VTGGIDYDGRIFRGVANSAGGEVGGGTLFRYRQKGARVWATYAGDGLTDGHLIATVGPDGALDMRYHHRSPTGALMTGTSRSRLEILPDGRYRLHEDWRWTCGDGGRGTSVVEEVSDAGA